jgi:hypothetical protein
MRFVASGRQIKRYDLASDNDSVYADADDVTGDVVLEESHEVYDASDGKVILQARIDRFHDDSGVSQTTGALDTNADADDLLYTAANLEGRIHITAIWNELQGVSDVVEYGTNGGSNFDRDGHERAGGITAERRQPNEIIAATGLDDEEERILGNEAGQEVTLTHRRATAPATQPPKGPRAEAQAQKG